MVRCGALLVLSGMLVATTGHAQEKPPPHAPDGSSRERIQSITILPTQNAPFRATVSAELVRNLPDGTTSTMRNHRTVARDSAGRIFEERRAFSPEADKQVTRITNLQYIDPARRQFLDCHPEGKTCVVYPYTAPGTAGSITVADGPAGVGTTTTEDLGRRTIDNLEVLGSREVTILKAGAIGNETPQPIIKEFWYSPHLQINLIVKRFDPRSGQQNFTASDVSLTEPNPALLEPPADFRMVPAAPYSMPH